MGGKDGLPFLGAPNGGQLATYLWLGRGTGRRDWRDWREREREREGARERETDVTRSQARLPGQAGAGKARPTFSPSTPTPTTYFTHLIPFDLKVNHINLTFPQPPILLSSAAQQQSPTSKATPPAFHRSGHRVGFSSLHPSLLSQIILVSRSTT
jgi:hypothetical protein